MVEAEVDAGLLFWVAAQQLIPILIDNDLQKTFFNAVAPTSYNVAYALM
jgi:hypothetical protein